MKRIFHFSKKNALEVRESQLKLGRPKKKRKIDKILKDFSLQLECVKKRGADGS